MPDYQAISVALSGILILQEHIQEMKEKLKS
jgi:hypothetical protein